MHEEYLIPAKPTIPNGWTYVELTNTPFEIPLPPKYSMKDLSQDDTLMTEVQSDSPVSLWESSQFIFDIWTGKEHQFFSNLDQFFRSICNPDFPEGNGDYRLYYSTVVNGINVMKFYPSCIGQDLKPDAEVMNIEIMLLVYQNKFYQVELSDQKFTDLKGEQLLETSMLNIRPRKVPNVSQ